MCVGLCVTVCFASEASYHQLAAWCWQCSTAEPQQSDLGPALTFSTWFINSWLAAPVTRTRKRATHPWLSLHLKCTVYVSGSHSQRPQVCIHTLLVHDVEFYHGRLKTCRLHLFSSPPQRGLRLLRPSYWDAQTILYNLEWRNKSSCIWMWLRQACASCVEDIPGAAAMVLNPDLSQELHSVSPRSEAGVGRWDGGELFWKAALFTIAL